MGLLFNRSGLPWQVPVWFMRQAGRYHSHYRNLKESHSFVELCKTPSLACQVTMGPMDDFGFDAAILFSDILFPLEQLGLGLEYSPGPKLSHLVDLGNVKKVRPQSSAKEYYQFQVKALELLKKALPQQKSLLGFVGAPFTLYTYAVEGGHTKGGTKAKKGLYSGLYREFMDRLLPELAHCMAMQAQGGADALCLFDTAAGELSLADFKDFVLPDVHFLTKTFKQHFPHKKIIYYSKHTSLDYLLEVQDCHIDVLGFDWRVNMAKAFELLGQDYYLQGNFDPSWLHLSWEDCHRRLVEFVSEVDEKYWEKWIFGLGHGVLVQTPQENVKKTVDFVHEHFKRRG